MADVLGEGVVAHHRTVLVPPLGGPQVHAHGSSVSAAVRRENVASSCAHTFRSGHPPSPAKKPMESRAARDPAGRNVPTDRKLRFAQGIVFRSKIPTRPIILPVFQVLCPWDLVAVPY